MLKIEMYFSHKEQEGNNGHSERCHIELDDRDNLKVFFLAS